MSKEMNTENNPEHECQMNPNDYQVAQTIAPAGSFWWAFIQLKLGKNVRRRDWAEKELLHFVPRRTDTDGQGDYLSHMDKRNKHGNWAPWQTTQEDLLACDWVIEEVAKPEPDDSLLVFDLTPGMCTSTASYGYPHYYGYTASKYYGSLALPHVFGTLSVIQNKTEIENTVSFMWGENNKDPRFSPSLFWHVECQRQADGANTVGKLFKKALHVTVDGVVYVLGTPETVVSENNGYRFDYYFSSSNKHRTDAEKLSALLKQSGQAKRFSCQWH
ncbi:DUF2829 domain-containing protein [Xenorhabdus sp. 12]|uniref:DUF2829 domain-containing protein n=1 Tax=Xenorhabdus santafensis TaxID=2582833 RepID=A0ABU4SCU1_9GAMM|nr:DUF2829 domain-containing protein [Xenorhabdus sp. 12]MDX7988626.1 DUF2829 domain-containing protein [Xenorhabdus sp. 12]